VVGAQSISIFFKFSNVSIQRRYQKCEIQVFVGTDSKGDCAAQEILQAHKNEGTKIKEIKILGWL
jgi:hypothetical protein